MALHRDDLPANLRRAVDAAAGKQPARRTSRSGVPAAKKGHWRCATEGCGAEFTHLDDVDAHVETARHYRVASVLHTAP